MNSTHSRSSSSMSSLEVDDDAAAAYPASSRAPSFRGSDAGSPTPFSSTSSDYYYDHRYALRRPMCEYEEIASSQWLSPHFWDSKSSDSGTWDDDDASSVASEAPSTFVGSQDDEAYPIQFPRPPARRGKVPPRPSPRIWGWVGWSRPALNISVGKLGSGSSRPGRASEANPLAWIPGLPRQHEAELLAAGWPEWLVMVAGKAIRGWVPLSADSFVKLGKLGQGDYCNVYKARNVHTGKIVALKKVHFDHLDPESLQLMEREIHILRRLDHPNIMKLEGLVTSKLTASLHLVFEYMEHDLAGLMAVSDIKFSEPQIKSYMHQLLCGINYCHSQGVVHRDINTCNILINNSGILRLAGFGLASLFNPNANFILRSHVVTLWYRPPELLLGSMKYGVAVDLWSTGCILAELLVGKPIIPGKSTVDQLDKIFKLCGSPYEEYWRKFKLPIPTILKPELPYERRVRKTFKRFPSALDLLDTLLAMKPEERGTAASALKNEFFSTKPLACDPSTLPAYPPTKYFDILEEEEARRLRELHIQEHGSKSVRRKKVPEAMPVQLEDNGSGTRKNRAKVSFTTSSGFMQKMLEAERREIVEARRQATLLNSGAVEME